MRRRGSSRGPKSQKEVEEEGNIAEERTKEPTTTRRRSQFKVSIPSQHPSNQKRHIQQSPKPRRNLKVLTRINKTKHPAPSTRRASLPRKPRRKRPNPTVRPRSDNRPDRRDHLHQQRGKPAKTKFTCRQQCLYDVHPLFDDGVDTAFMCKELHAS